MSTRQIRRYLEKLAEAKPTETPEEPVDDFEPLYVNKQAGQFGNLDVGSLPSSEAEDSNSDNNRLDVAMGPSTSQVKTKAKKKRNNKKRNKKANSEGPGSSKSGVEEVERIVREVNQMLGEPKAPEPVQAPIITIGDLLKVEHKYLDLNVEFDRLFGPEEEGVRPRKKHENYSRRHIAVSRDTPLNFSVKGLRMVLIEVKDGVKYFKFSHSGEYQRHMAVLLKKLKIYFSSDNVRMNPQVFSSKTVEAALENINLYFQIEETTIAIKALEQLLHFMQSIVEQGFNYTDGITRLPYLYVENRAFHVALLRYVHVLTNKACHRTALEVAKVMLNLDPSDPLAIIFMIDVLALRAHEHRWLVTLYETWEEKALSYLFHMRYSVSLAMWHIARSTKDPEDMAKADEMLGEALIKFPTVAPLILVVANKRNEDVCSHQMFNTFANFSTPTPMIKLQFIYVKYTWMKWNAASLEWLKNKCIEAMDRYDSEIPYLNNVLQVSDERSRIYRKHPIEMKRHLHSILSMTTFLPEPEMARDIYPTMTFNPYPSAGKCIDKHRYYEEWGVKYSDDESELSILRRLFASLLPFRDERAEVEWEE